MLFFLKKFLEPKMCHDFWFPLQLLFEPFLVLDKDWARYFHKCTSVFMQSRRYSCQISMKGIFSLERFSKNNQKHQISWKSVQWEPEFFLVKERTDELTRCRFTQFCERAWQHLKRRSLTTLIAVRTSRRTHLCLRYELQPANITCGNDSVLWVIWWAWIFYCNR